MSYLLIAALQLVSQPAWADNNDPALRNHGEQAYQMRNFPKLEPLGEHGIKTTTNSLDKPLADSAYKMTPSRWCKLHPADRKDRLDQNSFAEDFYYPKVRACNAKNSRGCALILAKAQLWKKETDSALKHESECPDRGGWNGQGR